MLLDTNAITAWAREDPALMRVLRSDRLWVLPTIALGEYRFGLKKSNLRVELEKWIDKIEASCTVLHPDSETARHYAEIRYQLELSHIVIPYHDIWIAALAIQTGYPVVTRDAHFDHVSGIRRIDW
jgi:predicted nucleic acid-binding protein